MNKIEKLIKELCPNGVEWKKLGEICSYTRGITYNKNQETEDDDSYKVLRANNIDVYLNKIVFDDIKKVSSLVKVKKEQFLKSNDILICAGSGSKDHIGKIAFIKNDIDYTFGGFMAVIRPYKEILNRYIFHILASELFKSYLNKSLNSTTINNLNSTIIESFSLPLPPLPIQTEIVRILDKFVEQQEQLERLIELRKKQYEYYREEMLKPKEGEKWETKTLGEIGKISIGKKPNEILDKGTFEYINAGTTCSGYSETYNFEGDTITTPSRGEGGIGFVGYQKKRFWCGPLCYAIKTSENNKFIYHYLTLHNKLILDLKCEGGVPALNRKDLITIEIQVPPVAVQEKIVHTLDSFETTITTLTTALELSKKRYEYYRDKMMRF